MRYITVDRRGPYLWVTFDRPDKLNVLHAEDLPGLRDLIVDLDPGVAGLGTFAAQETRDQIAYHYRRITGSGS